MTDPGLVKDTALVVCHAEMKAIEVGAGVGLLIAIPGLALAPMKVNPNDAPPLVAAATIAGTSALFAASLVTPQAVIRIYNGGKEGVHSRAKTLRSNERQKFVDRMAKIGAVAGIALETVRIRAIARIHDVPATTVATTPRSLWELFGFAVAGAAVGAGITTIVKVVKDKISESDINNNASINTDEMRELVDNSADKVSETLPDNSVADSSELLSGATSDNTSAVDTTGVDARDVA